MSAIVNSCVNKCNFITQTYEDIINTQYGTEDCCNDNRITLCDLILACSEASTLTIPRITTTTTYCQTTINCSTLTTNIISVSCNKIELIEI